MQTRSILCCRHPRSMIPQLHSAVPQGPSSKTCYARVLGRRVWCMCSAAPKKQKGTKEHQEKSTAERQAGIQTDKHSVVNIQQVVAWHATQQWQQMQAVMSQPGSLPRATLLAAIGLVAVLAVRALGRSFGRPEPSQEVHLSRAQDTAAAGPAATATLADSSQVQKPPQTPAGPAYISSQAGAVHGADSSQGHALAANKQHGQSPAAVTVADSNAATPSSSSSSSNGASNASSGTAGRADTTNHASMQQTLVALQQAPSQQGLQASTTSKDDIARDRQQHNLQDVNMDMVQVAKDALKASQRKVVLLEAMVGALRDKLNDEEDRNTQLKAEVVAGREELERVHGARAEAEARVEALQRDVQSAQTALQQAQTCVHDLEKRVEQLVTLNQQLQARIAKLEAQVAVQSAAAAQLAQDAAARINAIQADSDQSVSRVVELRAALADKETQLQAAKDKLAGYEAALASKDVQLQHGQDAAQQMDSLLTAQAQQLKEASSRAEQAEALLETTSADMRASMEEAMALVQAREKQVAELKQQLEEATAQVHAEASLKASELDDMRAKMEVALRMARAEAESSKRQLDLVQLEIEAVLKGDQVEPGAEGGLDGSQPAGPDTLLVAERLSMHRQTQLVAGGAAHSKELQDLSERQVALSAEIVVRRKALQQQASQLLPGLPSEVASQVQALMSRHAALLSELQQAEAAGHQEGAGAQVVSGLRRDLEATSAGLAMLLRAGMSPEQLAGERALRAELQDRETELRAVTATIVRLQRSAGTTARQLSPSTVDVTASGAGRPAADPGLAAVLGQRLRDLLRQRDEKAAAAAEVGAQERERALEARLRGREEALMAAAKEREEASQAEIDQLQQRLSAQAQHLADDQQAVVENRYKQQIEATRAELATRIKEAEAAWRQQLEAAQVASQLASNERQRLAAEVTLGAMQARQQLAELNSMRSELKARTAQLEDVKRAYENSQAAAERRASQAAAEAALAAGQVEALQTALQEREKEVHQLKQLEQQAAAAAAAATVDQAMLPPDTDSGNGTLPHIPHRPPSNGSNGGAMHKHGNTGAAPHVAGGRELFTPGGFQPSGGAGGWRTGSNGMRGPSGPGLERELQAAAAARELSTVVATLIDTALGPTSPQQAEERIMTTRAAATPAAATVLAPHPPAPAPIPKTVRHVTEDAVRAVPKVAPASALEAAASTAKPVNGTTAASAVATTPEAAPLAAAPAAPSQPVPSASAASTSVAVSTPETAPEIAPETVPTQSSAQVIVAPEVDQHSSTAGGAAVTTPHVSLPVVQSETQTSLQADGTMTATAADSAAVITPVLSPSPVQADEGVEDKATHSGSTDGGNCVSAIETTTTATDVSVPSESPVQVSTSAADVQPASEAPAVGHQQAPGSLQAPAQEELTPAVAPSSITNDAVPATAAAVAAPASPAAATPASQAPTAVDQAPTTINAPPPPSPAAAAAGPQPVASSAPRAQPAQQQRPLRQQQPAQKQQPAQQQQATDKGSSKNGRPAPTIMPSSMWGHAKPVEAPAAADSQQVTQQRSSSAFPSTEDLGAEINRIAQSLVQRQAQPQQQQPAAAQSVSKARPAVQAGQQQTTAVRLQLVCGASMQPHDAKAATGGEDAFFLCYRTVHAMGVADGVGGWASEGVDVSAYAHGICDAMRTALETQQATSAVAAMDIAQQAVQLPGSCTTCVALLHPEQQELEVATLGDSSLRVIRGGRVVAATQVQEHAFNMPYQLACPDLFPDTDLAADARQYKFKVQPGDIIVLATDGLWDNLWEEQVVSMLSQMMSAGGREVATSSLARRMAQQLTQAANAAARDPTSRTPWAVEHADATGNMLARLFPRGGKMDDITTCVAIVTAAQQ